MRFRKLKIMLAEAKLAYQWLSILELAEALGNVSEACRQRGMIRAQFYEYKKRFKERGLEGLKDLPPIHKSHPQTTPPAVQQQVIALSLEYPKWGCVKLSDLLRLRGVRVSSPTVQNILSSTDWARSTTACWRWNAAIWKKDWH